MISLKTRTCATLLIALSLSGAATATFAQAPDGDNPQARARDVRGNTFGRYGNARAQAPDSRENALRVCSKLEEQAFPPIKDSNRSFYIYRACMNEHGQPE